MTMLEREYTLPPMGELRLVTSTAKDSASVVILRPSDDDTADSSRADIFGAELVAGTATHLPAGRSFSVFSPTGCSLTLSAPPSVHHTCYGTTCGATFARSMSDIHTHLETLRVRARQSGVDGIGPRLLVVSDRCQVGVSTYVRTLLNYALRLGYHPLLLDAHVESPRFGYPAAASLYAMQNTIDLEEEMGFVPGVHVYAGAAKHEDPSLFLHAMRELTALGTERMARSDRCRVGGLFVDYGVISPFAIDAAEAAELDEEHRDEKRWTNPLDTLIGTILEVGIDHVLVVQSAWLRFKLAQRMQRRFAALPIPPTLAMLITPTNVVCPDGLCVHFFLVDAYGARDVVDETFVRRQRWLQYFFGTTSSPVRPTLISLEMTRVRIVQVGRGEVGSSATFMPMDDNDEDEGGVKDDNGNRRGAPGHAPAVTLAYLLPQDVALKDCIVAISAATEYEELSDGTLQRVPFAVFESRLRRGLLMGFALVESASSTKITLLTNATRLRKDCGLCLILTEERLATKSG